MSSILHNPNDLSLNAPSPSVHSSFIVLSGDGNEKGGTSKLSVRHCPVVMSRLCGRLVNVVVRRYIEPLSHILCNAMNVSLKDKCTRQSRQKTKSTFGSLSSIKFSLQK